MSRVAPTELKAIFDTSLEDASLQVWLDIASDVVDDIATKDNTLSSTRLENIEKLFAAHLASSQDQRIENTSRETASVTYQGETGMDINGTKYGQQAAGLDPTGTIASYGKPKASISVPDVKGIDE